MARAMRADAGQCGGECGVCGGELGAGHRAADQRSTAATVLVPDRPRTPTSVSAVSRAAGGADWFGLHRAPRRTGRGRLNKGGRAGP